MIYFYCENISLWNIKTMQTQQQDHSEQIHEFVQHLLEAMLKITDPLPEALTQLLNDLDELPPKDKPRHIANPTAFVRMCNILNRNTNPTMGELSQALAMPLPTATRMVDWCVENGYAERLSDASDRRIVRVAQTAKGRTLQEAIESIMAQSVQKIVSCLTDQEQTTLLALLRKIASALAEDKENG
jgi:DNA-binding MarR family transcriptional regulator